MHAAVPFDARKPTQAAAHKKLAWMRSTRYVITRLQLGAYIYARVVSQLCCVTDLAHTRNAASRRKREKVEQVCDDLCGASPPLKATTALS